MIPVFFLFFLSPSLFIFWFSSVYLCLLCFTFLCMSLCVSRSFPLSLLVPTTGRHNRQTERAGSLKRRGRATQRETEIEFSVAEAMKSIAYSAPQTLAFLRLKTLVFFAKPFFTLAFFRLKPLLFWQKKRGFPKWGACFPMKTLLFWCFPCF